MLQLISAGRLAELLALIEHYDCGPVVYDLSNQIITEHTVKGQWDAQRSQTSYYIIGLNAVFLHLTCFF